MPNKKCSNTQNAQYIERTKKRTEHNLQNFLNMAPTGLNQHQLIFQLHQMPAPPPPKLDKPKCGKAANMANINLIALPVTLPKPIIHSYLISLARLLIYQIDMVALFSPAGWRSQSNMTPVVNRMRHAGRRNS
jgi:hypothetical protein